MAVFEYIRKAVSTSFKPDLYSAKNAFNKPGPIDERSSQSDASQLSSNSPKTANKLMFTVEH